jgi:hypothetical protein
MMLRNIYEMAEKKENAEKLYATWENKVIQKVEIDKKKSKTKRGLISSIPSSNHLTLIEKAF